MSAREGCPVTIRAHEAADARIPLPDSIFVEDARGSREPAATLGGCFSLS